jgi:hypothetical protein
MDAWIEVSATGGDDLAAHEGTGTHRGTLELRRRLAVLVIELPLLLQIAVGLLQLPVGPVPEGWELARIWRGPRWKRKAWCRGLGRNLLGLGLSRLSHRRWTLSVLV